MTTQDNLAAVLYGIKDIRLEQRPILKLGNNQVLLKIESVGICGSDMHYFLHGGIRFKLTKPMIIGHEASGTVYQVGKNVNHLHPGDRVAIEPGVCCRICSYCKEGNYHLCPSMVFCGGMPNDGNLCRFFVHDADFCHRLPERISLDEGALIEPLAVGVHACKRANIRFGDRALIMGAGPIGLVTLMAAKAMGATKILITDVVDFRLQKAKEVGADYTLKIEASMSDEEIMNNIRKLLGEEPNVSLDCTGVEQCVRIVVQVTKTGGVVILIGMGKQEMSLPLTSALTREVDIKGVYRYCNDYPAAIQMVKTGKVNVKTLITHHYKIEDTEKAFQTAITGEGNPVKILIHPNPDRMP